MKLGIKDNHFILSEATDAGLEPPPKKIKTLFNVIAENTVEIDQNIDRDINKYLAACVYLSAPTKPTSGMRTVKNIHHLKHSLKNFSACPLHLHPLREFLALLEKCLFQQGVD